MRPFASPCVEATCAFAVALPTPFDYISILGPVRCSVSPSCWVVLVRLNLSRLFSVLTAYLLFLCPHPRTILSYWASMHGTATRHLA